MNIFENLRKITKPYGDDEYEDEYEDEELDDFDDEPVRSNESRRNDFGTATKSEPKYTGPVMSMNSAKASKPEVVLFRPTNFADATKAADDLRNKKAVIANLEHVDKALNRRIIDFLTGCAYALDGKVNKIANNTYLFCPYSMDVVGDLDNAHSETDSYV